MPFMDEQDAMSGKAAKAYVTIDGQIEELFYARTGEVSIEKRKADVPVLGRSNVGRKSVGWEGTGSLTLYYVSSVFRQRTIEYIKTGRDFYFDLHIINDDPTSNVGRQTIVAKQCNFDTVILAQFDATTDDVLEEEMPFSFMDADILESFTNPSAIV